VLQESILRLNLFNIFISDLGTENTFMLMKCTEVAKVESIANTKEDGDIVEKELYDCDDRVV